jgi:hypothetical protein
VGKGNDVRKIMKQVNGAAKEIFIYLTYSHNPYEPLPTGRKIRQMFGFSKESIYQGLAGLLKYNIVKAVGDGTHRKLYINPGVIWKGSEETRQFQIKKLEAMAKDAKVKQSNWPPYDPPPGLDVKPKRTSVPKGFARVTVPSAPVEPDWLTEAPFDDYPEDAE